MLLLLFHIGNNLYAIETSKVVEILPMVMLRRVQPARDSVVGVFNYRGRIIPAVDLCHLVSGKPSQTCYRTRIILVQNAAAARPIGLIAERVSETLKISIEEVETAELINASPELGQLLLTEQGMVQLIHWEHLVSDALAALPNEEKEGEGCKTRLNSF
jgi:chemotaxis-related protein WspB